MTSFLVTCPQCGTTIAKDAPCPDCRWTEKANDVESDLTTFQEFAFRHQIHKRNYLIFMLMSFAAGLVSLLTALMWVLVIYRGNVLAFLAIGLFTVVAAALSGASYLTRSWFPVDLNCPICEVRLDELGPLESDCPNCGTQLVRDSETHFRQPAEVTC